LNVISKAYRRADVALGRFVAGAAKAIGGGAVRFAGRATVTLSSLWRTAIDYSRVDPLANSAVMACLLWVCRTFPEAPVRVLRRTATGTLDPVPLHPLAALLERPNPYYSGPLLWMATVADFNAGGNAYWYKVRSAAGRVVQLWWLPATTIEPYFPQDGSVYIAHYEYKPGGATIAIPVEDVVHFRFGLDPKNVRKGLSPLASVLREVYADDEAANFGAALLRNLGVPGVVIAPGAGGVGVDEGGAEAIKARFMEKFGGDKRGEPMVLAQPSDVKVLSFSPEQMDLKMLRRLPEERVSAVLGVPAVVAGLGAGLDRSCVPAYARVQTPYGTKTIAEIEAGAVVWSFKDGQIVPRLVEHKWPARRDVVYEVRTSNRRLHLTGNHPLMVRVPGHSDGPNEARRPRYEWRSVGDVRVGDHIIFAKSYPDQGGTTLPDGRPATAEALQFFGAIIGDGTVSPGVGVRIAMPLTDRCAATYRGLATTLFTKQARQSGGVIAVQRAVARAPITIQQRERDFGFSSAEASRWLATLGLSGRAHTKRVPSWVYGLSRDLRLAFLAGVVDSDGYVDARGALTVTFCNRALLEDVRDLAIGLGIRCSNVGHRVMTADVLPQAGTRDRYESWTFTASSARQVADIPFADPLYRARAEANPQRHRAEGFDACKASLSDDLGFAEVKAIVPLGEMDVYDLTVEDGHSFFCENVLVSNTYSNMAEAREAAYESNIIPTQRLLAAEIASQLLPDFEGNPERFTVDFDISGIHILQEDKNALIDRWLRLVLGGTAQIAEARAAAGLEVRDEHKVYLVPSGRRLVRDLGEVTDQADAARTARIDRAGGPVTGDAGNDEPETPEEPVVPDGADAEKARRNGHARGAPVEVIA